MSAPMIAQMAMFLGSDEPMNNARIYRSGIPPSANPIAMKNNPNESNRTRPMADATNESIPKAIAARMKKRSDSVIGLCWY